jgi:hypothetical protein
VIASAANRTWADEGAFQIFNKTSGFIFTPPPSSISGFLIPCDSGNQDLVAILYKRQSPLFKITKIYDDRSLVL